MKVKALFATLAIGSISLTISAHADDPNRKTYECLLVGKGDVMGKVIVKADSPELAHVAAIVKELKIDEDDNVSFKSDEESAASAFDVDDAVCAQMKSRDRN